MVLYGLSPKGFLHVSRTRVHLWEGVVLAGIGAACGAVVAMLDVENIDAGYVFPLPLPPIFLLPLLATSAALVNALGEELLWRGVLLRVGRQDVNGPLMLWTQTLSFGAAHYYGIPQGMVGVLAAALYSALIFSLFRRYGFLGAVIVHLATDIVIFLAVIPHARFAWSG